MAKATNGGPMISCLCVESAAPFPKARVNATNSPPSLQSASSNRSASPVLPAFSTDFAATQAAGGLGPPGGRARLRVLLI
jgi:hypothetical protein